MNEQFRLGPTLFRVSSTEPLSTQTLVVAKKCKRAVLFFSISNSALVGSKTRNLCLSDYARI